MDVHPPHQPIHSLKDFGLRLLTITIGLFIALTLETSIEANHALYTTNVKRLQQNQARLTHDIDQLRQLRSGAAPQHTDLI